jgi:hypothetical protein
MRVDYSDLSALGALKLNNLKLIDVPHTAMASLEEGLRLGGHNLRELNVEFASQPDSYDCNLLEVVGTTCRLLQVISIHINVDCKTEFFHGWQWPTFPASMTDRHTSSHRIFATRKEFEDVFGPHWTANNFGMNKSLIRDLNKGDWIYHKPLKIEACPCWTDKRHVHLIFKLPLITSIHIEQVDWLDDDLFKYVPPQIRNLHLTGSDSTVSWETLATVVERTCITGRSMIGARWINWDAFF